jgi:hypothetical protein
MLGPFWIAGSMFKKQRNGVLVSRKEPQQRAHVQGLRKTFQGVFVAGQRVAIHEDIESRIFSLDHDI